MQGQGIDVTVAQLPCGWAMKWKYIRTPGCKACRGLSVEQGGCRNAGDSLSKAVFADDAILIEKYMRDYAGTQWVDFEDVHTQGSLSVHVNANRDGNGQRYDHWLDFAVQWYGSLGCLLALAIVYWPVHCH